MTTTIEAHPISPLDHQGLVRSIARVYLGRGMSYEDLIQEGQVGLLRACEMYDPARNAKFGTYATYWIRNFIRVALRDKVRTIRVPAYLSQAIRDGQTPETPGLTRGRRACLRAAIEAHRVQVAGSADLATRDVDLADLAIEATPPDRSMADQVLSIIASLPDRERTILTLRFGLDGEPPKGRVEIGRTIGVTRERIRQIENQTLLEIRERLERRAS